MDVGATDDFDGFEWDEAKSARCLEERGFDFDYAAKLFDGDFIEVEDRRRDWGEARFVNIGEVEGHILVVIWTPRGNTKANYLSATGIEVGEGGARWPPRGAQTAKSVKDAVV
ncbi:MAG TPA: BrnT family toxin [bacterium]|nr:BrnT family toxin [bacterium]